MMKSMLEKISVSCLCSPRLFSSSLISSDNTSVMATSSMKKQFPDCVFYL